MRRLIGYVVGVSRDDGTGRQFAMKGGWFSLDAARIYPTEAQARALARRRNPDPGWRLAVYELLQWDPEDPPPPSRARDTARARDGIHWLELGDETWPRPDPVKKIARLA
jgi:hypothetical protein